MTSEAVWDDVSHVRRSKYRRGALLALPATPSDIAERRDMPVQAVSRALSELRKRDIVRLVVDEETRQGRIYGATERGVTVRGKIEELEAYDDG